MSAAVQMSPTVHIVGAGRMGLPIARRLVASGLQVSVTDSRTDRQGAVEDAGALWCGPSDALTGSDLLLTILPGRLEVEQTLPGILGRRPSGTSWVDLTSGDPALTEQLADLARAHGVAVVGAPMGGGPADAVAGTLTFYVGGSDDAVASASPVLDVLGRIERVGSRPHDGQSAKLLANLLWFGQVVAVSEATLLGQALGLELDALRALLSRSAGGSRFIDDHLGHLLDGDYLETFGLDRCVEELQTVRRLGEATGTPLELAGLVTRIHEQALDRFGARDGELLAALLLEEQAGRMLRR